MFLDQAKSVGGEHAAADAPLDQLAAAADEIEVQVEALAPAARAEPEQIAWPVQDFGAGTHQVGADAREELLEQLRATAQQDMQMTRLGDAGAELGVGRQPVTLDQDHLAEVDR